jgi:hypothetical protein
MHPGTPSYDILNSWALLQKLSLMNGPNWLRAISKQELLMCLQVVSQLMPLWKPVVVTVTELKKQHETNVLTVEDQMAHIVVLQTEAHKLREPVLRANQKLSVFRTP